MAIYLHDIPLEKARSLLETALQQSGLHTILGEEWINLDENAVGRVLSQPVWARLSSPHYHASAMDGFAVRAADSAGATPNHPVSLVCRPINTPARAGYLDTGDALPDWADAVIPIENVESLDLEGAIAGNLRAPYAIRIRSSVTPWSNVRVMGEDMVATQLVLPAGHVLRPVDLGAIAGSGHSQIRVARKPKVAIIPTGTELAPIGQPVREGEIIEYNSIVLAAQINTWGGEAHRFPIVKDDFEAIRSQTLAAAKDHDLVLIIAGSSAGSEDFTAQVVGSLGNLLVHGVAVRPGHPVIIGMLDAPGEKRQTQSARIPIIGIPGYPVSATLTGEIFVEPLLALWSGRQPWEPLEMRATITRKVTSPPGDDDYLRLALGRVGDQMLAAPLSRGSGVITSLVRADGIAILPRGTQGLPAGSEINVRLYRSPAELERTIFAIGSHDMTLDLLAQFLAPHRRRLTSANVGSLGGLIALQKGEAHVAGSHLFDPEKGEYNISFIRKYLKGIPVVVVGMVIRDQGLIVQKGNPMHLSGLTDLANSDVNFVNRQRGAGTRVLLDYQLGLLKIDPLSVKGYQREEYTHLAVAAAVASGRADCGLGIAAAAQALDLDFIPLFHEPYQLIVPEKHFNSELLSPVWEVLKDSLFHQAVSGMPGYDISSMGKLVGVID